MILSLKIDHVQMQKTKKMCFTQKIKKIRLALNIVR